jgi:colanic acid/amylovoran biosynthesis glycosyltransferase
VADWLHAADVYTQPSLELPTRRTEGLPVAVLEALAVGLLVVATRSGGLPELAEQNQSVSLVPAGDAGALGRAVGRHLGRRGESAPIVTAV